MKERLLRVLRFLAYPAFYLFCLALFGYLTFPFARLKDRVVAELQKRAKKGQRVEIDRLGSYWFTGLEVEGVRLYFPKDDAKPAGLAGMAASAGADEKEKKESVVTIDEAHARLKILPLVIGRLKVGFWLSALGGEIKGVMPILGSSGDIQVELENVDIGRVEPFVHAIGGVPIHGIASGKVDLSPENGKLSKGSGTVELTIADVVVSDGKTKIQGLIELPAARMGDLTLSGEAKDGILVVNKLEAKGTDIELLGAGKVGLHDNWQNSVAELFVRFKFSDSYRGKNDLTKGLFGAPGGGGGGLIEMQVPKMKRAKRPDGFYGFHAHGPLKKLSFDPTQADGPGVPGPAASGIAGPGAKRPAANNPFMHKGKVPQPNGGPGGQNRFNPVAPGTPAPSAAPAAEAPAAAPEAPAAEAPAAAPAPEPPAPEPQPEQPAEAPAE